ncbi:hypothetical protein EMCG_07892 [[Emmonsia] crescens]|uniref:BRCT domain-containing protein n=1 Tax=[Emmonsia] crescens TaxID=73230 RepID=A0A0G2I7E0_9EURO|nr:hypothetical protein EMCG_07892 [Emmonsia crescens UAMH 3008]
MAPRTATLSTPGSSPPKRMTRARAARNTEASDGLATAPHKETKAADKTTATTKGRPRIKTADIPAAPKPAVRRKPANATSNTDGVEPRKQPVKRGRKKILEEAQDTSAIDGDSSDDEMDIVTVKSEPKVAPSLRKPASVSKASAAKTRKAVPVLKGKGHDKSENVEDHDDDDELAQPELPKQRPGKPKTTSTTRKGKTGATQSSEKAPVGRPRKATTVAADDGNKGTSKTIHISAASLTATSAASRARTTVPRKKVTFLDMATDSDKENQPMPASTAAELKHKIKIGIKGKPVRKPAPTSGERKSTSDAKEEIKKEPLSPKKATQIARSGSSASSADDAGDDDSSSPRSRVPRHNGSPTKRDRRGAFDSPVKNIDFVSPVKPSSQAPSLPQAARDEQPLFYHSVQGAISADSIMLSSPARKLPPSPYKESMRDSPRRAPLQPAVLLSCSEAADKREYSPLKISPRKGNLGASFSQSLFKSAATPSKGKPTLLQSPAKRPPSPIKSLGSRTIGRGTPSRRAISALQSEETLAYHVKPSVALDEQQESATKPFDQNVKEELNPDDVFTDCTLNFDMSVLEVGHSLGGHGDEAYHPVMEEASDETPMKTPAQELDDPFVVTEITSTSSSPVNGYEIFSPDASVSSLKSYTRIPPAAPSPPVFIAKSSVQFVYRDDMVEDSDDELMADVSPIKFNVAQSRRETLFGAAGESDMADINEMPEEKLGFTPLAERLSKWDSISPVKRRSSRVQSRGIFSPLKPSRSVEQDTQDDVKDNELENVPQPLAVRLSIASDITVPTFFDDEMAVHHRESMDRATMPGELDNETTRENGGSTMGQLNDGDDLEIALEIHEDAEYYEAFGDENAAPSESTVPIDPGLFDESVSQNLNPVEKEDSPPLRMSVTPVRSRVFPRTIHTVSKVPLRPDGDGSVLKVPRKRSRSLSSSPRKNSTLQLANSKIPPTLSPRKGRTSLKPSGDDISESETESKQPDETPVEYSSSTWPRPAGAGAKKSPSKSKSKNDKVLQGAVVFADVHTAEGADASGIFVELLTQMGARCVKSWSWNPRASLSPVDGVDPKEGKVGITHVVFKDGGVRTLEKVREANGLVKCVGVGWVLDCERKSKWLDEINYGVDVSLVPRGGQKRRKSMEPRALSNMNGSIIKLDSSTSSNSGRRSGTDRETFQELMRLSPTPPSSRRESMEWEMEPPASESQQQQQQPFAIQSTPTNLSRTRGFSPSSVVVSPTTPDFNYAFDFDGASAPSPITPYYPSQGTKLAQQTCPPKQLRQGLFDNGRGDSQMSDGLRIRLEAARRRSLVWKPKVGSPLGRPGMKF